MGEATDNFYLIMRTRFFSHILSRDRIPWRIHYADFSSWSSVCAMEWGSFWV